MKSYPCETLSWPSAEVVAEIPAGPRAVVEGCSDAADGWQQPPFSYQPEGSYGRQLFWRLVATVLLAAITALAWLSLIGSAPGANAHTAARAEPSKPSISATTWQNTKYDGRQDKWTSTA
jgi:hypothetical protein